MCKIVEKKSPARAIDLQKPKFERVIVWVRLSRKIPKWKPGMSKEWNEERLLRKQGEDIGIQFTFAPERDIQWPNTIGDIGSEFMDKLLAAAGDDAIGSISPSSSNI
jgi:hypothetical protein